MQIAVKKLPANIVTDGSAIGYDDADNHGEFGGKRLNVSLMIPI